MDVKIQFKTESSWSKKQMKEEIVHQDVSSEHHSVVWQRPNRRCVCCSWSDQASNCDVEYWFPYIGSRRYPPICLSGYAPIFWGLFPSQIRFDKASEFPTNRTQRAVGWRPSIFDVFLILKCWPLIFMFHMLDCFLCWKNR